MEYMGREDMLKYLEELNSRLAGINRSCEVVIFGGAAMSIVFEARDATRDIDAKFRSSVELRRLIKDISDDFELDREWLNNDGEHYVTDKMQTSLYPKFLSKLAYTS